VCVLQLYYLISNNTFKISAQAYIYYRL